MPFNARLPPPTRRVAFTSTTRNGLSAAHPTRLLLRNALLLAPSPRRDTQACRRRTPYCYGASATHNFALGSTRALAPPTYSRVLLMRATGSASLHCAAFGSTRSASSCRSVPRKGRQCPECAHGRRSYEPHTTNGCGSPSLSQPRTHGRSWQSVTCPNGEAIASLHNAPAALESA